MTRTDPYSDFSFLDISIRDHIATVLLNKPSKLNACDAAGHTELSTVLRVLQSDEAVRAVVVTGAGRAFSVGGDLDLVDEIHESPQANVRVMNEAREIVRSQIDFEKPIVAAVNGVAMGASLAFALLCDYIVMERQARIADGHIRAALGAGDGGALIWPLTMGLTKAKKYLMTGDWLGAEEAERLGLVSEVVNEGQSFNRAMAVARRLADGPQFAIRATKMALNQWLRVGQMASFDFSLALEFLSAGHEDVPRALRSIREGGAGAIAPDQ